MSKSKRTQQYAPGTRPTDSGTTGDTRPTTRATTAIGTEGATGSVTKNTGGVVAVSADSRSTRMRSPHRAEGPPISKGGAKTREQIIEAAGEIFAEKGFQGATSREICLRACVNLAAVNYHFGGFEALYIATLKEAHRYSDVVLPNDVVGMTVSPKEKLQIFLRSMISRLSQSMANSWQMRLVSRELVIPTFAQDEYVATSIAPRRAYLKSIIGEIIGRSPQDPLVARCLLTVIAPCVLLSMTNRSSLESFHPDLTRQDDGIEDLVDHIERFVFAGLEAVMRSNNS